MTTSAHEALSAGRPHRARTVALLVGAAAVIGAGVYFQRHREELATLGGQHGVPAYPQT
ncbi:hypothetical protein [Tomitella biformata]|uniref:hypothetical protein n=1 Tax=Tomitella biformata TaxID=630403 RepID=UPI0004B114F5|nr:hypothetical protein [Tomitella biformata]